MHLYGDYFSNNLVFAMDWNISSGIQPKMHTSRFVMMFNLYIIILLSSPIFCLFCNEDMLMGLITSHISSVNSQGECLVNVSIIECKDSLL